MAKKKRKKEVLDVEKQGIKEVEQLGRLYQKTKRTEKKQSLKDRRMKKRH